jgi:hypothetical protein
MLPNPENIPIYVLYTQLTRLILDFLFFPLLLRPQPSFSFIKPSTVLSYVVLSCMVNEATVVPDFAASGIIKTN